MLFDLFGTLIPTGSRDERDAVATRMAQVLDVDPGAFAELVRATFDERCRGRLGSLPESVRRLAERLGAHPSDAAVDTAVQLRLELTRSLHRGAWALPVLAALARLGFARGLVSDCSAETPLLWPDSPLAPYLDAVSFSCLTGHRKPEPEAYLTATRALGVDPRECLFVGDGGSRELTGAAALGMTAVRFAPPGHPLGEAVDVDADWVGVELGDLGELGGLLEQLSS
ncbi:MAG TPA: HAD family hydrolase [Motilibacteraceae bacterium]|nr:HAD family hydrolase [Motilibacteraceae bacterium]